MREAAFIRGARNVFTGLRGWSAARTIPVDRLIVVVVVQGPMLKRLLLPHGGGSAAADVLIVLELLAFRKAGDRVIHLAPTGRQHCPPPDSDAAECDPAM